MTATNPSLTHWKSWVVVWSMWRSISLGSFDGRTEGAEDQGDVADMAAD